jgi:hypothetical protein
MKKVLYTICILHLAICHLHSLPAFPGAEGWGADNIGGRGGKVYVVTNLNSSGPGSFNEGFRATGPRTIVFRVSGVIDVNPGSQWFIAEDNAYLTVAGQTSPGGVTLVSSGGGTNAIFCYWQNRGGNFHNGVFRFLRFRATDRNNGAVTMNTANNFIFDHCDFSGSYDETLDNCSSHHFTIQWSTVTNSASDKVNKGHIMAYLPNNYISVHHNLYAHHRARSPLYDWLDNPPPEFGMIDHRNNVSYNSKGCRFMETNHVGGELHMNCVGNYFKAGPTTESYCTLEGERNPATIHSITYVHDNYWEPMGGSGTTDVIDDRFGSPVLASAPYDMPKVTTYPVKEAYEKVLDKVGAWPRDVMNIRTIDEVRNGTGQHRKIDDPLITSGPEPPDDTDMDGMPDYWETFMGFNINDPADNNGDHDGDGYTNIEEYINDLALILLGEEPHNPNTDIELAVTHHYTKSMLSVYPNPYHGNGNIYLKIISLGKQGKKGMIRVTDIRGRIVKEIKAGYASIWNGRDSQGQRLASGMYLLHWLDRDKLLCTKRMIMMR